MYNVSIGISTLGGAYEDKIKIPDAAIAACANESAYEALLNSYFEAWAEGLVDTCIEAT